MESTLGQCAWWEVPMLHWKFYLKITWNIFTVSSSYYTWVRHIWSVILKLPNYSTQSHKSGQISYLEPTPTLQEWLNRKHHPVYANQPRCWSAELIGTSAHQCYLVLGVFLLFLHFCSLPFVSLKELRDLLIPLHYFFCIAYCRI